MRTVEKLVNDRKETDMETDVKEKKPFGMTKLLLCFFLFFLTAFYLHGSVYASAMRAGSSMPMVTSE